MWAGGVLQLSHKNVKLKVTLHKLSGDTMVYEIKSGDQNRLSKLISMNYDHYNNRLSATHYS